MTPTLPPRHGRPAPRRQWLWFGAWVTLGVVWGIALLGALTIGVLLIPFAALNAVLIARRPAAHASWPGILSGAGIPLLYVAYRNRRGPGTVCAAMAHGGQRCTDYWNPWPWAAAGLVVVLAPTVVFVLWHQPRAQTA